MVFTSHGLGKHISNLKISGDMWKRNNMEIHSLPNRMTIHFDMFSTLMKNMIDDNLDSTHVVSMEKSRRGLRKSNFCKEATKPNYLRASSGHDPIFRLRWGFGHTILFLALPRDQRVTKKHTPTGDGTTSIRTTSPISITKCNEAKRRPSRVEEILVRRTREISNNTMNHDQV